jgi:hypothetical protein
MRLKNQGNRFENLSAGRQKPAKFDKHIIGNLLLDVAPRTKCARKR